MQLPEKAVTAVAHGVQVAVKVVPGSSRDRIAGCLGDALKLTVAAPPEAGKANKAVCKLLAKALGCNLRDVQVVSGATSPQKHLLVTGVTAEQVRRRLTELLG